MVVFEDKLSSTTVDFIRSDWKLKTKYLYWIWKPKKCKSVKTNSKRSLKKVLNVLNLMVIRCLRSLKVLNLIAWKMWKVLVVGLRSGRVLGN